MQVREKIAQLSDRQRELLELVASGTTASKDLARETGLSPGYIDKVLSQAAKSLGSKDRLTASATFKEVVSSDLLSDLRPEDLLISPEIGSIQGASPAKRRLRIAIEFFRGPKLGGEQHSLRWDQITLNVLRVAAIGLISVLGLVLIILAFFRTFS